MKKPTNQDNQPLEWWQDLSKKIEVASKGADGPASTFSQIYGEGTSADNGTEPSGDIFQKRLQKHEIKNLKQNRKMRKRYASWAFYFMVVYSAIGLTVFMCILIYILYLGDQGNKSAEALSLPLAALASTITASMVLFGWVLKGLFSGWRGSDDI